jgi:hypothetical protein
LVGGTTDFAHSSVENAVVMAGNAAVVIQSVKDLRGRTVISGRPRHRLHEAQRWLMAPENKQQVIELLAKESHLAPEVAAETYEIDMQRGWSKDVQFNAAGFRSGLQL